MNDQNYWLMKFRKNVSFLLVATTIATMFSLQTTHAQNIPAKPNIIVIMADDLDVGSLNVVLSRGLMPHFKRTFVDQGIKFKNSFVTNSVCCPSRATYLSGQYTHNHQTLTNFSVNGTIVNFDDTTALPTWLSAPTVGYRTAHVGKYLNAYGILSDLSSPNLDMVERARQLQQHTPSDALRKLSPTYIPPGWSEWYALIGTSTYCVYNYKINQNGQIMQYLKNGQVLKDGAEVSPPINDGKLHYYQTDILAEYAKRFIERNNNLEQPFFLSIMPLAPHIEGCQNYDPDGPQLPLAQYKDAFRHYIRPAPRHLRLVPLLRSIGATYLPNTKRKSFDILDDGKPAELHQKLSPLDEDDEEGLFNQYGNRLASLLAVDDLIGHVTTALGDQLNNTVMIFTADNGWFYGEHQLSGKQLAYEEAIRVPLYMRLPQPGSLREIDRIVLNNDLAPTIAELAGSQPTCTVDGQSLIPLIQNPTGIAWRKQFLVEHYLGQWPEDQLRFIDYFNLFAVRTGPESTLPNRVYIEHYDGIQKKEGYYFSKDQSVPSGDFVWNGTLLDKEYYNMNRFKDPLQVNNLFFNVEANPNRQKILSESDKLKSLLDQFHLCKGDACWQIEKQQF